MSRPDGASPYEAALVKNHRWNRAVNVIEGSFFQIGFTFFVPAVILVAYLKHFTDDQLVLNLPILISNLLMTLGPFVMSFYSARITAKKRMLVRTALLQRLSFLPVVGVVFFIRDSSAVVPFLATLSCFFVFWGISSLFWQELMGRAFSSDRIGSAMGVREGISRVVGFGASLLVIPLLGAFAFPSNYALLLGLTFVAWMFSYATMTRLRDAPYVAPSRVSGSHWKEMVNLPREDGAFRWYIAFIVCLYGFLFVGGLYTVVGLQRFGKQVGADQLTGIINTLTAVASALLVFFGGRIADRFGKFWGFLLFTVISLVLNVGMMFCTDLGAYLVLTVLSGVTYVIWVLELTTVLGFAAPEKRHQYVAVMSVVKILPIVVYTNLGGWLANAVSYEAVFAVAALFTTVALVILVFKLRPLLK